MMKTHALPLIGITLVSLATAGFAGDNQYDLLPLIDQTDPRLSLPPAMAGMPPVGCYDASIITVVVTAVGNRDPKLGVANRTKQLMDIPASATMPKPVAQLRQQYIWAYDFQHGIAVNGKVPNPMYINEALADVGGKVQQPCNPYSYGSSQSCTEATNAAGDAFSRRIVGDALTNEAVIDLMKKGYATIIAFGRYRLQSVPDGRGGVAKRMFVRESQHKVVFSGFHPGKYPLLVNDVGNGQRYRVRLSTDLKNRGISSTAKLVYPLPTHTFLEYENEPDSQVFFIDAIDGLKIETGGS